MIEFVFWSMFLYGIIAIPYKLWITSGKYDYLKKDTDSKIETLEFNNQYYIDQINNYATQVNTLAGQRDMYYSFWSDSLNRLLEIEDIVSEMPDSEDKTKLEEALFREEEDND